MKSENMKACRVSNQKQQQNPYNRTAVQWFTSWLTACESDSVQNRWVKNVLKCNGPQETRCELSEVPACKRNLNVQCESALRYVICLAAVLGLVRSAPV